MNIDVGIINQQGDSVGVIKKYNLRTLNPPQGSNTLGPSQIVENKDICLVNLGINDGVGGILESNLRTYNLPQPTPSGKWVESVKYDYIEFNRINRPLFWENQRIQGT